MEPGQSGKEKKVTPHRGARSLRRGKQGGGAPQERGKVPPKAEDQSGTSWEAELRKGTREKDGQKGGEGDGRVAYLPGPLRTHSPQRSCVHTSVRPFSLRVPYG